MNWLGAGQRMRDEVRDAGGVVSLGFSREDGRGRV